MAVYAEWYWSCDLCEEHAEEPWGDQDAAEHALEDHMREDHPEVATDHE